MRTFIFNTKSEKLMSNSLAIFKYLEINFKTKNILCKTRLCHILEFMKFKINDEFH